MRLLQPVDRDVAAIDPMGSWRCKKDDDVGHLLGRAEAAHRKAVPNVIVDTHGLTPVALAKEVCIYLEGCMPSNSL